MLCSTRYTMSHLFQSPAFPSPDVHCFTVQLMCNNIFIFVSRVRHMVVWHGMVVYMVVDGSRRHMVVWYGMVVDMVVDGSRVARHVW